MCGRYAITTAPEAVRQWFGTAGPVPNFGARYNAAPGQELPVVRRHPKTGERVLGLLRWGLIPHWSNDPHIASKTINARGETVSTVSSFRDAYRSRRCLVPADAFYEWKANGTTKQAFAIALRDRQLFAFAGLWENWKDTSSSQWVRTFTILTTKPNELVAPLHDRMPLILAQPDYEQWLDPMQDPANLIRPHPADEITAWPISTRVNRSENDDPGILDRIELSSSPI